MIFKLKNIRKTAVQAAVFYFVIAGAGRSSAAGSIDSPFEAIKTKVVSLLSQKQKKQALAEIDSFLVVEKNRKIQKEAREFKQAVSKKFLNKEAQEFYEVSLNSTLENVKEAKKNDEECLSLDPENLDCLIQKIRLSYRDNPNKFNDKVELEKVNKFFTEGDFNWVKASVEKNKPEFKNLNFYKKETGTLTEEKLIKAILEVDRAYGAKNFSRAKEVLQTIEKDFKDWPDLIYFRQNIDIQSTEDKGINATETANLYQTKCKNLSKTVARKYRYDFDLCLRGN